tara:strand:+ start:281 stop:589 length:309 start_codon:yes stop_codon:yes gene_type:complete
MKLSYIIIPHETKLGSTEKLLRKTLDEFYIEFGGCTHYPVTGICKGHTLGLPCEKIEVAVQPDEHDVFIMMAKDVADEAGVKEIMVQDYEGDIHFIPGKGEN